ncbi:hypothetical protein [Neobacillus niacini]|uniref:hypothetical protein n=1 Tax=Neobacillus niacini TaxID=86668 RepID=UPI00285BF8B7|nr:hypothetical protein [Neobacillus niacini]MDR7001044.1 DNA invertase Pin-like site-specific DNA recombinase [Neobacillus niacini]
MPIKIQRLINVAMVLLDWLTLPFSCLNNLKILSWMAEDERNRIRKRQRDGIFYKLLRNTKENRKVSKYNRRNLSKKLSKAKGFFKK